MYKLVESTLNYKINFQTAPQINKCGQIIWKFVFYTPSSYVIWKQ